MADSKISALTAVASVAGTNEFGVNEAGTSKKASGTQISTFINANITLGAALAVNSQEITSAAGTNIVLHSDNDCNVILGDAIGVDDFNIKDSADVTVFSVNSDGAITAISYGGILEANLLDLSAVETVTGAWTFSNQTLTTKDITSYDAVNDGNPEYRLGATDAEELHIQTVYDTGAQTLNYVLFTTDVASLTANKGLYRFNVDGTDILDIDDGGVDLKVGKDFQINGVSVLSSAELGINILDSSLTSVGTLTLGTWNATAIGVLYGGTGQTTYTNGQLLIGNTTGNTLTKATLTQGTGMSITNGTGTITLAVADNYLLNTGDVGTGVYDFGGATSFEVPNGAGGTTVDATGELTIDSTSGTMNFYDGTAERALSPVYEKAVTIESPTATEDVSLFNTNVAGTIFRMVAVLVGSATPSVTWTIRKGSDRSAAGTEVVTGGTVTTSTTTGSVVTSFNSATLAANDFIWLETTAQSGTVNSLNVTIFYRKDP